MMATHRSHIAAISAHIVAIAAHIASDVLPIIRYDDGDIIRQSMAISAVTS